MRRLRVPALLALAALLLWLSRPGGDVPLRPSRAPTSAARIESPEPPRPASSPASGSLADGAPSPADPGAPRVPMRPVVRGSVTAPDGSLLPGGFSIHLVWKHGRYSTEPIPRGGAGGGISRTYPAGTREFLIPTGRVGRFRIAAESPGRVAAASEILAGFSERSAPPVAFALPPAAALAGTVSLEPEGKPAAGVSISVSRDREEEVLFRADRTETGPDGAFRIDGIPAGTWHLVARVAGRVPVEMPGFRLAAGEERSGIRIGLIRGGRIEGFVEDESGAPIRQMLLRATAADGRRRTETTESDGRYAFEHLEPGSWVLAVEGAEDERLDLVDRAIARRDYVLPAPSGLTVEVWNGGSALRCGAVLLRPRGEPWRVDYAWVGEGWGWFSSLAPGEYELWVSGVTRSVTLAPGEERTETFRFDAGIVEGRVVHASDGEGRRAGISLTRTDLPEPIPRWVERLVSGPDGRFRFDGVPPGDYVLSAAIGPAKTEEVPLALAPGSSRSNLVLTLRE